MRDRRRVIISVIAALIIRNAPARGGTRRIGTSRSVTMTESEEGRHSNGGQFQPGHRWFKVYVARILISVR